MSCNHEIFKDKKVYSSLSEGDTLELAELIASRAKSGSVFALFGDLGVGKTVFSKGFAKGLGIREIITSPTFTIMKKYDGDKMPLYHYDLYRLTDYTEMEAIGIDEYLFGDGVSLIEWAEKIVDDLPSDTIKIEIKKNLEKGYDYREIWIWGDV